MQTAILNNRLTSFIRQHGVLCMLIAVVGFQIIQSYQTQGTLRVLGYATNISISELLNITNQNRAANSLGSLALNSQLNSAAQAKANHMIQNNYWAHYAPDGTSPWFFVNNAGYSYSKAGENLAYGYNSSSGVLTGWMNSPSHAANILDSSFTEVGFGTADGANFQGGENTVVVAFYAQPQASAPVQQPSQQEPPATSNTPPAQQQTTQQSPPVTADTADEEPAEVAEASEEPEEAPLSEDEEARIIESQYTLTRLEDGSEIEDVNGIPPAPKGTTITNLDIILSGDAPASMYLSVGALMVLTGIYLVRHTRAIYQFMVHGEHFIVGHPLLEAGLIYAVLWLVLAGTYGVIL